MSLVLNDTWIQDTQTTNNHELYVPFQSNNMDQFDKLNKTSALNCFTFTYCYHPTQEIMTYGRIRSDSFLVFLRRNKGS